MRAAIMGAYEQDLDVEELQAIAPGPRDVVVAVGASGICHTDLSVKDGLFKGMIEPPMIGGHEGAGTVIEVGSQVSRVAVGDRVISVFRPACGNCHYCNRGKSHLCDMHGRFLKVPRAHRHDGAECVAMSGIGTFADVMTCDESSVVKVETDLPDSHLALLGCGMTTGVGAALFTANMEAGATCVVVGLGGVGQSVVQGAVVAGASRIIAIDPVASKRDIALRLGATDALDPADGGSDERVRELTGGRGVDYAFDVVGLPDVVASSYKMLGKGGTLLLVGYGPMTTQLTFPAFDLQSQEKTVKGCVAGSAQVRRDFQMFVDLIERGRLDTASLVSSEIHLDEINVAMKAMHTGEVVRSVITSF